MTSVCIFILVILFLMCSTSFAADMPVNLVLEQRYRDDDVAVVVPERLEMWCESAGSSEWNFSFPAFETRWQGPIELEVKGSGDYARQDIFSIAGISIDYGGKDGWIERSIFGLGLIQESRNPHPPSWGVGSSGKTVMRGNLVNAGPEPQKVVIDPAKYAPEGWDGRLWIGLLLHNTGKSKSLYVRILNGGPASVSASPEPDRDAKLKLIRDHQKSYLEWRLDRLESRPKPKRAAVVEAMKPYAEALLKTEPQVLGEAQIRQAISEIKDAPLGAERFLKLVGDHYSPQDLPASDTESRINKLYTSWKESGSFGKEIGCIVRTASNLEKVGITDIDAGTVVKADPDPIKISAAKHEYEGFQVVFSGLTGCAEKVKVAVTNLKNGNETISATNIKVNPVGYVRIFENQPREMLSPDPLLIGIDGLRQNG